MIRHGFWWLDQWNKAHSDFYDPVLSAGDKPKHAQFAAGVGAPLWFAGTGLAPAAVISGSPYAFMQRGTMFLEDYVERKAYNRSILTVSPRVISNRFVHSAGKRAALKFSAKLGARAIPYAGWALLGYDLWSLGKWIGEKTS